MSQLALVDVSYSYNNQQTVIENTSFTINRGEYVGIVGPSGSGKSTLLKLLLGLIKPKTGKIHLHVEHSIGYVPQLETIDWYFPVVADQVIAMGIRQRGITYPWLTSKEKNAIQKLLNQLLLTEVSGRHIKDLSSGQQQRVFLARALIDQPDILLLDEPTSSVDIKTRDVILHLLETLQKQGLTIVITTHDLNSVAAHLPRVICFNKIMIADGHPQKIFTKKILDQTYNSDFMVIKQKNQILITDKPHHI